MRVSAPSGISVPRPGGQLLHELGISAGAADAVQAPQARQDVLHLRPGENGAVHPVALQNGDPASRPLDGDQGNPRPAQGLHVPLDGPAGTPRTAPPAPAR